MKNRVFRVRKLPTTSLMGEYFISRSVISATGKALPTFRDAFSDHEGAVFWGGRETPIGTFIIKAVVPVAEHSSGRVYVSEQAVLETVHRLREDGLGLVAQVHSHTTEDARHSEGDDRLVLMPYEGMLSIVVPHYGKFGLMPLSGCGVHQFQDGVWRLCTSGLERVRIISASLDLR
jgi:proteasome lid subunit RPN8/RPN11